MSHRIAVLTLTLAASLSICLPASAQDLGRPEHRVVAFPSGDATDNARLKSTISGSVRTQGDHPVRDARIEIRDLGTGTLVASAYSSPSGNFEVSEIPDGTYEVVATSGLSESREQIHIVGMDTSLTLRMPLMDESAPTGQNTVSVAAMQVPGKARKEFEKARELLGKNNIDEAKKHLAKALEIYPGYSDALTLRGVTAMAANDLKSAADDLNAAIQHDNNNAMAYVAMGALYNKTERFDDALRSLDRGVALNPTSWQAFFEMSRAELGKGDYTAALRQATKAEGLVGQVYGPIYLVKAHAMLGLKDYSAAIGQFEKYLSTEKDDTASISEVRQQIEQLKSFRASAK